MRTIKQIKETFKNPWKIFYLAAEQGYFSWMSDELYLKCLYRGRMGKKLDLVNPKTFNEKLQWLKLYNRRPEYTMMVDKYLVRDYIAEKLCEAYLIPLLGVWDNPDEIDFDVLPNQFVLKCNHNSGLGMCICKDKSSLDVNYVRKKLIDGLKQNYYLFNREWPYKDVSRKIIAEQFMEEEDGTELKDYKIHCFHGEPKFILVCSDRFSSTGLRENFYDIQWNLMDMRRPKHPNTDCKITKPEKLAEMLECARILSKDIPFSRIDFYVINHKVYFGEITFFPSSGFQSFEPEQWDTTLGSWLILPQNK